MMARAKNIKHLAFAKAMHKAEHRVIYADTDAGQVVYYANYFRWFESGRREIMRALGISYIELEKKGVIMPVVEAHCNYFHPARYDDVVLIETKIADVKEKSVKFENKIYRKKDKKLLASGYTINVFVDRKRMKSIRIPDGIRRKIRIG
jgi:acyl-CoA thioester hydrolase